MTSKLLTVIAGGALALSTSVAVAQMDGAPGGEKDRTGATTDSGANSAIPAWQDALGDESGGTTGQGSPNVDSGPPQGMEEGQIER
jgi:hypothetical protein